jgi:hypothetical protein
VDRPAPPYDLMMITPQVETRLVWSTTFARRTVRNNNFDSAR